MSNKKNKRQRPDNKHKTILQQFQRFMKSGERKASDIIQFLIEQDEKLMGFDPKNLPGNVPDELADFYEFFEENYGRITYEARKEVWEDDSLVLYLGEHCSLVRYMVQRKQYLDNLSPKVKTEADLLSQTLCQLPPTTSGACYVTVK